MEFKFDFNKLIAKGTVDDQDVAQIRRSIYSGSGSIDDAEAHFLFQVNDGCKAIGAGWAELFVEAIVEFTVHQSAPQGYVSEENATWLMERIDHSGVVKSDSELEVLIKVLEAARDVPESLECFALEQVKYAVLTGDGPTRTGLTLKPGEICRAEVELLRRILYACAGGDGMAISRKEAEVLFDINDAVTHLESDASWSDLFIKAVANYLMAARGYQSPSREEALRREAWLDDQSTGVGEFFGKVMAGGLRGVLASYQPAGTQESDRKLADIAQSEVITDQEVEWLADRIGRDGQLDASEKALLTFIKEESPNIHPSLKPLLAKVA